MKKWICLILAVSLVLGVLSACDREDGSQRDDQPEETKASEMFTNRDQRDTYDTSGAVTIRLEGDGAIASSSSVKISGSTVQITQEATYLISGTLTDGMLVVNAPDTAKIQLVFQGVNITSSTSAAVYILEADKVFLTLDASTNNSLANGGEFLAVDDNNIDAALFSKQDLTINGSGSLQVTSPAGHGIVCKDDLVITGGDLNIEAAGHALDANDSIRFTEASLIATAGKDGLHCENSDNTDLGYIYISGGAMQLQTQGDGISAGSYLQIQGGSFDILAGGGSENGTKKSSDGWGGFAGGHGMPGRPGGGSNTTSSGSDEDSTSMKGIKSVGVLSIEGGSFVVNSADDAIHSDSNVTILRGTLELTTGDDGVRAEENLDVQGGSIVITESYEGLEAQHIQISGGDISLKASDDGLNAAGGVDTSGTTGGRDGMFGGHGGMSSGNGSILISGGKVFINASGDGIDANGTLEITGGYTVVTGPTQGDTSTLDFDKTGTISGGTFIGTGAYTMAQSFSDPIQSVVAYYVGNQSANTQITLTDEAGNVVLSHTPVLDYQVVILSCPQIQSGSAYTLVLGTESYSFVAD